MLSASLLPCLVCVSCVLLTGKLKRKSKLVSVSNGGSYTHEYNNNYYQYSIIIHFEQLMYDRHHITDNYTLVYNEQRGV